MDSALRGSESVHSIALGPLAPADAQVLMGLADQAEAELRLSQERRKSVLHARADSRA